MLGFVLLVITKYCSLPTIFLHINLNLIIVHCLLLYVCWTFLLTECAMFLNSISQHQICAKAKCNCKSIKRTIIVVFVVGIFNPLYFLIATLCRLIIDDSCAIYLIYFIIFILHTFFVY